MRDAAVLRLRLRAAQPRGAVLPQGEAGAPPFWRRWSWFGVAVRAPGAPVFVRRLVWLALRAVGLARGGLAVLALPLWNAGRYRQLPHVMRRAWRDARVACWPAVVRKLELERAISWRS